MDVGRSLRLAPGGLRHLPGSAKILPGQSLQKQLPAEAQGECDLL
jgi:hypothetical protein